MWRVGYRRFLGGGRFGMVLFGGCDLCWFFLLLGFGDFIGKFIEEGLTVDAFFIYEWIKARSGIIFVCFWGYFLGIG